MMEGFTHCQSDHSLFVKGHSSGIFIALLIYVDEKVIASNDECVVKELKESLGKKFRMKDLGSLKYFLGLEVARSAKGISITQRKRALELLAEAGQLGCKLVSIPMEPNLKLSQTDGEMLEDPLSYRRLIWKLIYLTIMRPDLSYAVNRLSQFFAAPCTFSYEDNKENTTVRQKVTGTRSIFSCKFDTPYQRNCRC